MDWNYIKSLEAFLQNPWGHGLATAGPIAFFNVDGQTLGGETLYLTIANSRGLVGLVAFVLIPIVIVTRFNKIPDPVAKHLLVLMLVFALAASVPTEQWIGFQSSSLYWLFLGFTARLMFDKKVMS